MSLFVQSRLFGYELVVGLRAWALVKAVCSYLWLVGNGRMIEIVVIVVPHSSIPYSLLTKGKCYATSRV